jgi:outer membrane protein OmpA-like peptidoglycan-associated protein
MKMKPAGFGRMGRAMLLAAVTLGLTGCAADGGSPFGVIATEEWVRHYVREQNAQIQANVAKVDGRVTQVDGRVTQVAGQTTEARKVADGAARSAGAVDARLTSALNNRYKRELVERVILFFDPGKSQLTPVHEHLLKGVLKVLAANPTHTVDIVGFADASGSGRANLTLSWHREEAARRYLAVQGREINRISFIGLGEDVAIGDKNHPMMSAADRRLTVLIYRQVQ